MNEDDNEEDIQKLSNSLAQTPPREDSDH